MQKQILTAHNLSIGIDHELISDINFGVSEFDRIGVIGQNGSGKTTLLRTIANLEEPFSGSYSVGGLCYYIPQTHQISTLSGGQQSFQVLKEGFLKSPDILLLDEPTNHLDIDAKQVLIDLIKNFKGAVICISHDVWFLEQITNRLWIINDGKIRNFTGSYREYKQELMRNEESRERQLEVVKKEKRKLELSRSREEVRSARSKREGKKQKLDRSKSRMEIGRKKMAAEGVAGRNKKQLDEREEMIAEKMNVLVSRKKKRVSGTINTSESRGSLIRIKDAALYVQGKKILDNVSLDMQKGDRIAITGKNGSGKSALVKAILEKPGFELDPKPYLNSSLRCEYLDQHYSIIDPDKSVVDNVANFSGASDERIRQHLSHFLFSDSREVLKKAKQLSGGMMARLAFVMLTIAPIDLLILDEPTNNLDIETVDAIKELLMEYRGGLIVISHDIDFVESLHVQRNYLVDGVLKPLN